MVTRSRRRVVAAIGTAVKVAVAGLGAPAAADVIAGTSWRSLSLDTSGGNFRGEQRFYASNEGDGGFVVRGDVCDTNANGDGIYGQARVAGYGWSAKRSDPNGAASGCGREDREFADGAVRATSRGQYRVCQTDFGTDTCKTSPWYDR